MFYEKIYPYILVTIQLSCLTYIAVSGPLLASGYAGIFVESTGIFLGIFAIYINGIGNFNVTPKIKENGQLITTGPYGFIRHPMYSAQLIAVLPLIIDHFNYWRFASLLLLLFVLLLKVKYEERSLKVKFKEYADYTSRTKRLIPFIY